MTTKATIFGAMTLLILALASCKTTEENYRNAYQTAKQHQIERAGGELPDGVDLRKTGLSTPRMVDIDGRQVPMISAWVITSEKELTPLDSMGKYVVVVATFKQVFNARQMKSRISAGGVYHPVIMKLASGYYLVGTDTTDNISEALTDYEKVKADSIIRLKAPFPYVFSIGQKK